MQNKEISIKHEGDHYTVYIDNVFFCSADTHLEAVQELEKEGCECLTS